MLPTLFPTNLPERVIQAFERLTSGTPLMDASLTDTCEPIRCVNTYLIPAKH